MIINVVVWGPILSEIDIWLKICGLPEAGNDPRSFLSLGPRAGDGHRVGPRSLAECNTLATQILIEVNSETQL